MSARRRLVLWRHGRTAWNVERRHQGHTDVGLDQVGVAQARAAAEALARLGPRAIVSSDLARAASTAEALASLTGLDVTYEPGLRERHGGDWQGRTPDEIVEAFPGAYARWRAGEDVRPTGGETVREAASRALEVLCKAVAPLPPGATLVAATHGAVARGVVGSVLGLPPERWPALGGIGNGACTVLEVGDERWRVLSHNVDACSLPTSLQT